MFLSPFKYKIGITLTSLGTLQCVVLKKTVRGWIVANIKTINPNQAEGQNIPSRALVSAAINPSNSIIKFLKSDLSSKKHIVADALFRIEPTLPFSINESIISSIIYKRTKQKKFPVTIIISKKDKALTLQKKVASAATIPDVISVQQLDIFNMMSRNNLSIKHTIYVFFSPESIICILGKKDLFIATRSIDTSDLNSNPLKELKKTVLFFQTTAGDEIISQLIVCNASDEMQSKIQTNIQIKYTSFSLPKDLLVKDSDFINYGHTITTAYIGNESKINLLDYTAHKTGFLNKLFKQLFPHLACLCSISVSIILAVHLFNVFSSNKLVFKALEKARLLNQPEILKNAASLNKFITHKLLSINSDKTNFYIRPKVKSASYIINEISNIESLKNISITDFKYIVESHPSDVSHNASYKVNVLISGHSTSSSSIAAFRNYLNSPSSYVLKNKDYKWSEKQNTFSTSFYLKDSY